MVKTSSTYIFRYFFCISGDFEGKMPHNFWTSFGHFDHSVWFWWTVQQKNGRGGRQYDMYQGRNHEIFLVVKNAYSALIEMIMAIVPQNLVVTGVSPGSPPQLRPCVCRGLDALMDNLANFSSVTALKRKMGVPFCTGAPERKNTLHTI